jgi:leader peptidase (prepilin peptidase)/N-methyltransferase
MLVFTVGSALLFLTLGMTFGSFLNVLVFRWPRGLPVSRARSRCPGCGIPIPKRDNVPVLGYLRLGGRCQCGESRISARYPLVEAVCGLAALCLFILELHGGGANLPALGTRERVHLVWTAWYERPDLLATWAVHFVLCYALFGMSLVQKDGFPVPGKLAIGGVAACLGILLLEPRAHVVPYALERAASGAWIPPAPWADTAHGLLLANGALGVCAGILAGLLVACLGRRGEPAGGNHAVVTSFAMAGLVLGWHGVVSVLIVGGLLSVARGLVCGVWRSAGSWPNTGLVWLATLVAVLGWRWLWDLPFWPEVRHPERALFGGCAGLAMWYAGGWFRSPDHSRRMDSEPSVQVWRNVLPFPPRTTSGRTCVEPCTHGCFPEGVDLDAGGRS